MLLIHDAALWSDGHRLAADALLIVDERIAAIGDGRELRESAPDAARIDAEGALVTPSFADAHVHAAFAGIQANGLDLSGADDAQECLRLVADYLSRSSGWVVGAGWEMPMFAGGTPTAELLDSVTGDRPTLLHNADHHGAWVNSAALRAAGVTATTPDPDDGRIERDDSGHPTGTLHEGAVSLVADCVPAASVEATADGVRTAWSRLRQVGVTAWQEALVGEYSGFPDVTDAYVSLLSARQLPARVSGALWVPRDLTIEGIPALVRDLSDKRAANALAGFETSTAKIMVDGVAENRTAALHEPYLVDGCACGTERGIAYFGRDVLFAVVAALAEAGFALHFHAIGDRAVSDALDAVETIPPDLRGRRRHHIAHVQIVRPEDVPRFAALGVTVNAQALWACNEEQMTELTVPIIGERRAAWQYPFRSFRDAGADLAMGSDWPVSTCDPWQAIAVAVTRTAPHSAAAPLNPTEALRLNDALAAYTSGSHDLLGIHEAGRLEVGALADVCIADRDPFAATEGEIWRTTNRVTIVRGDVVYDRDGLLSRSVASTGSHRA